MTFSKGLWSCPGLMLLFANLKSERKTLGVVVLEVMLLGLKKFTPL
jgi:hypothetical protein